MGRRSDHSRVELREIMVAEGHRQISETGYARFSAREVAKRVGYSVGMIYHVFGSYDLMLLAINGRTLDLWLDYLEARLAGETHDRLRAAINAYFEFAVLHRQAWSAVYDFRLPDDEATPPFYLEKVRALTDVIVREIAAELAPAHQDKAQPLAHSLLATVHGHCVYSFNGTFRILGESDPLAAAWQRVQEAMAAYR